MCFKKSNQVTILVSRNSNKLNLKKDTTFGIRGLFSPFWKWFLRSQKKRNLPKDGNRPIPPKYREWTLSVLQTVREGCWSTEGLEKTEGREWITVRAGHGTAFQHHVRVTVLRISRSGFEPAPRLNQTVCSSQEQKTKALTRSFTASPLKHNKVKSKH